jgi:hypothetical protein
MVDLIERLRASDTLSRGENYEPWVIPPSELRLEAAAEIETLRSALSQEREAREKAEKRADANADHAGLANANLKQMEAARASWKTEAERLNVAVEALEASLAEAKRLLKPFAAFSDHKSSYVELPVRWCEPIARFLSQEPNQ